MADYYTNDKAIRKHKSRKNFGVRAKGDGNGRGGMVGVGHGRAGGGTAPANDGGASTAAGGDPSGDT